MRLDALLFVMPDRTDAQVGFMNAEGSLRFAELDVGLPQLLVSPVVDVAAQDVSAFTELGPIGAGPVPGRCLTCLNCLT